MPSARRFKVGLVQMSMSADPKDNLDKAAARVEEAARLGAEVMGLPELFRSPYFCQREDAALFDLAEPVPGPSTERLSAVARSAGVAVVVPVFERRAAGLYHNSAYLIDADGSLRGLYRKMHISDDPAFYEKYYFAPGDLGFQAFDVRPGRIAENDLCANIDQFIGKEQTAFEHFLVNEHTASCLCSYYEYNTQQVGRKSGPGMVVYREDTPIHECLYLVNVLRRDINITALYLELNTQLLKFFGNDTKMFHACILDGDLALRHGRQPNKAAYFDHIGQHAVRSSAELRYSFDGEEITADATDACTHAIEDLTQLLHIRFTGSIINSSNAFSQYGCHDNVGSAGNRRFIQQHIRTT